MKNKKAKTDPKRKLVLSTDKLRDLDNRDLERAAGGMMLICRQSNAVYND